MCISGVESVEFPSAQEFTYISSTSINYTISEKKKKRERELQHVKIKVLIETICN